MGLQQSCCSTQEEMPDTDDVRDSLPPAQRELLDKLRAKKNKDKKDAESDERESDGEYEKEAGAAGMVAGGDPAQEQDVLLRVCKFQMWEALPDAITSTKNINAQDTQVQAPSAAVL